MGTISCRASRLAACIALATFFSVLPAPALAQPSFADSAERLIMAGQEASYQGSRESLERSIQLFQLALQELSRPHQLGRAGAVLNNIGAVHRKLGNTDSALVYFERALDARRRVQDTVGVGTTLHNLGITLYDRGRADTALVYFREALAVQRQLGNRSAEAVALGHIGLAHNVLSRADSAEWYLSLARNLAYEVGDSAVHAQTLEFTASMHQALQRPDSAEFYRNKAREIYRELGDPRGELRTVVVQEPRPSPDDPGVGLAELHQRLAAVRQAMDHRGEGIVLTQIGSAHYQAGQADSALSYYAQARVVHLRMRDQRSEGSTLTRIARVHAAQGRADSALAYYRWALPALRATGELREEGAALGNMAVLYHTPQTPAGFTRAVAYYDSADAVLAQVAQSAGGDQGWLSFGEMHASLFGAWTLAWLGREPQVGARRAAFAALAAAERGRAQALRHLMRRRAAPDSQQAGPARPGAGVNLVNEGRDLVSELRGSRVPVIAYTVTHGTLVAFLVRPGGQLEVFETVVSSREIDGLVADVHKGLGTGDAGLRTRSGTGAPDGAVRRDPEDSDAWRAPAARLADLLLPPRLREQLPESGELVIVPSGRLFLLPFSVLPLSGGSDPDSFLGLRYAIRYAPSLRVLASLKGETRRSWLAEQALVVGNPTMPRVPDSLGIHPSQLPHAEVEADSVAARLGASTLTGGAATEAAVRERMGSATLVHLATHGHAYTTPDSARDSYVVLAKDERHDGMLTVGEVLDALPAMRAELVVLSACETGRGDLTQAEGTVGMQRAFLARGARGVLVSLWSVRDESTSILMQRFYKHWLGDGPGGETHRAEALRQAQRDLVDRGFSHPRYWAPFQLVGAR